MDACKKQKPMETRVEIIRRVIALIDMMASWRHSKETSAIVELLNEKLNSNFSKRTIFRDLVALHEQGLVERESKPKTKRLVGSIRRTSESRRLDACSLARRSRQSEVAAEGGEEADGATASKPPTEGERLDTGNDCDNPVAEKRL